MGWIALLILFAGCADKYGALLDVDGKGAIIFDRVEFFFGKEVGGQLPTSPRHPVPSHEPSVVAKRLFVDADIQSTDGPVETLTYFIPDQPENEALGHYVAVLAFSSDQLVGIGELFDFEVMTGGAVYRYPIELVDARSQDIERWGLPTVDCLRWTRERSGGPRTVAVVRDEDTDCDAFAEGDVQNSDCLPRVYCDGANPAACEAQVTCVTTSVSNGCKVGAAACSNLTGEVSSCAANICVDEIACRDCGSGSPDASTCVVMNNNIHLDSPIPVHPDFTLCSEPFDVDLELPLGVECLNPAIISVADYVPSDKFTYTIASLTANACRLTIRPETPGAHFTTVPHMLIAIDTPSSSAPRTAFVIGLTANDGVCQSPATIMPQLSFGSCLP